MRGPQTNRAKSGYCPNPTLTGLWWLSHHLTKQASWENVWLLPPPSSSWRLRQHRLHCLHGWLSHLAGLWNPTVTGLWWPNHHLVRITMWSDCHLLMPQGKPAERMCDCIHHHCQAGGWDCTGCSLYGWLSHLAWPWNPTLTGLWWLNHDLVRVTDHRLVRQASRESAWLHPPPLSSWRLRLSRLQSLWTVVTPCLTMKPHPDWSLVTEPWPCQGNRSSPCEASQQRECVAAAPAATWGRQGRKAASALPGWGWWTRAAPQAAGGSSGSPAPPGSLRPWNNHTPCPLCLGPPPAADRDADKYTHTTCAQLFACACCCLLLLLVQMGVYL